jgi:PIN domain
MSAGEENTSRVVAFVDTNTLLHFQWLADIDWQEIVGAARMDILLDHVVLGELEEQKWDAGRRRTRERARTTVPRIVAALAAKTIREGVEFRLNPYLPLGDLSAWDLDSGVGDDRLIASILKFRADNPQSRVVLVSNDLGLGLKSGQRGIDVIEVPDRYLLADELDESESRLQRAEKEVAFLKNRLPELRVSFSHGQMFGRWSLLAPTSLPRKEIDAAIAELRVKHPALARKEPAGRPPGILGFADVAAAFSTQPSDTEIARYNRELEEYFEQYAQYLIEEREDTNGHGRTLKMELLLQNQGTSPAEDIRLSFVFPGGLAVYDKGHRPPGPKKPKVPVEPKALATRAMLPQPIGSDGMFRPSNYDYVGLPGNVSGPNIKKSGDGFFVVAFEVQRLIQHDPEPLEPIYVRFESWDAVTSFHVDWRAVSASLPKPVTGKLNVAVEKLSAQAP